MDFRAHIDTETVAVSHRFVMLYFVPQTRAGRLWERESKNPYHFPDKLQLAGGGERDRRDIRHAI
jgi:hypothetical protein